MKENGGRDIITVIYSCNICYGSGIMIGVVALKKKWIWPGC